VAKQSFASMSMEALLKMRDQIGSVLQRRVDSLKKELHSLGSTDGPAERTKTRKTKRHALKGRKVAAKYRDPKTGESWSGRGATAGWLTAHEKAGRKRDQYLIAKPTKKAERKKKR
jgi:DNA-binding protein H-NS